MAMTEAEKKTMTLTGTGMRPFQADYGNYASYDDWWNSLDVLQRIQAGMLGSAEKARTQFGVTDSARKAVEPGALYPTSGTAGVYGPNDYRLGPTAGQQGVPQTPVQPPVQSPVQPPTGGYTSPMQPPWQPPVQPPSQPPVVQPPTQPPGGNPTGLLGFLNGSFATNHSPMNYLGLFGQSDPFWGNNLHQQMTPTRSPMSTFPYPGYTNWNNWVSNVYNAAAVDPKQLTTPGNNYWPAPTYDWGAGLRMPFFNGGA